MCDNTHLRTRSTCPSITVASKRHRDPIQVRHISTKIERLNNKMLASTRTDKALQVQIRLTSTRLKHLTSNTEPRGILVIAAGAAVTGVGSTKIKKNLTIGEMLLNTSTVPCWRTRGGS